MNDDAIIGKAAPEIQVETWVQGEPLSISELHGRVVLVEVFQVNCPGCFVHALPTVLHLHQAYHDQGLSVIGLATAFEDFDKNTLQNLQRLVSTGKVIGEPLHQLGKAGLLQDDRLDYELPFAIGMEKLIENGDEVTDNAVDIFILEQLPDYANWPQERRQPVYEKARAYLESRIYRALTFETYRLQGTPSSILVDRDGILRDVSFGFTGHLEPLIVDLLKQAIGYN
ncbi:MAG: TlpA family protein disulfide reductase [Gammaproteobacteria bacterium]|nr:TlpA family protein disulfide reductase [Gammaproteobacteria bacterium]